MIFILGLLEGQSGLGKTTFFKTLFPEHIDAPSKTLKEAELPLKTEKITNYKFEMDSEDCNRVLIEAIDTPGFDDDYPAKERAQELLKYIEKTFDDVFDEEQRIHRNPKFEEHRIHALLYFIEPTGLGYSRESYRMLI